MDTLNYIHYQLHSDRNVITSRNVIKHRQIKNEESDLMKL